MNIGIDYDGTFSANPGMFRELITIMEKHGCTCYIVTARNEDDCGGLEDKTGLRVISTEQKAKARECFLEMIDIDIWIDDFPFSVCFDIEKAYELNPA